MIKGEIKTLYVDKEKVTPVFPTTKIKAVSDEEGRSLEVLLKDRYATKDYVDKEITDRFVEGSGDVDLKGYATKDEVNTAIDGVNSRINGLTVEDVGAFPIVGGNMQGSLNMQGHYIWGLVNPAGYDQPVPYGMFLEELDKKAPAGYGLGEKVGRYCADCWGGAQLGLYYVDENTANKPDGVTGKSVLLVEALPTDYGYGVDFYLTLKSGRDIWRCYYSSWAGAWQPWECENPPMVPGVEYRTTERWNGKSVYTKAVNFGNLPNSTLRSLGHEASATRIIRYAGSINSGDAIPLWYQNSSITLDVSTTQVTITTSYDASARTAVVEMWYTKD